MVRARTPFALVSAFASIAELSLGLIFPDFALDTINALLTDRLNHKELECPSELKIWIFVVQTSNRGFST